MSVELGSSLRTQLIIFESVHALFSVNLIILQLLFSIEYGCNGVSDGLVVIRLLYSPALIAARSKSELTSDNSIPTPVYISYEIMSGFSQNFQLILRSVHRAGHLHSCKPHYNSVYQQPSLYCTVDKSRAACRDGHRRLCTWRAATPFSS